MARSLLDVPTDSSLGFDPRSLACFRLGLGLLLLVDLATRAPDLVAHTTDAGVFPRALLLGWSQWSTVSIHLASGSAGWQAMLFGVAALAAIALALGWRTRLATLISWFLLASLQARNPAILHGGDALLRILLFWSLFVPLDRAWSLDRRQGRTRGSPRRSVLSVGTVALGLQICFLYWFSAIHKSDPAWWGEATAIDRALRLDQLTSSWGRWLLQFPELLEWATRATMVLELAGPLLVWIPFATARWRLLAVVSFVGFHVLGLAPALHLDLFPWVCAVAWTVFLPSFVWDRWFPRWAVGRSGGDVADRWAPGWRVGRRVGGALLQGLAGLALLYVLLWNLRTLDWDRFEPWLPESTDPVGEVAGLHQVWNLFAPAPSGNDGWVVIVGRLEDGRTVDLRTGQPSTDEKPADVAASFGSSRWRKLLINLPSRSHRRLRRAVGTWFCGRWNETGDGPKVEEVRLVYWSEPTAADGTEGPPRALPLWRGSCGTDG